MVERSRFWDGSILGDAVSITSAEWMDRVTRALLDGTGNQGVLRNWLNELEVTDGGGLNAAIDTGGAIMYGLYYENDTATTAVLPNNAVSEVVVRRSWAAQTARITVIAAPLVQNPGVTYDVPLAQVTTVAGAITLITDTRDFCEFSTEPPPLSVQTENIQANAVTSAEMINPTRWVTRGAGSLEPDATNATTWAWYRPYTAYKPVVYRDQWSYPDAATSSGWITLRVPADQNPATPWLTVYLWLAWYNANPAAGADQRWACNAIVCAPNGAWAAVANNVVIAEDATWLYDDMARFSLGNVACSAGDLVHIRIDRTGAHAGDTSTSPGHLAMVEFSYEAVR